MAKKRNTLVFLTFIMVCSAVSYWLIAQHQFINANNRFISFAILFCSAAFCLILLFMRQKLLRNLILSIVAMTAFAFVLVPIYNVFCDVTGLNGKMDLSINAAPGTAVDLSRKVIVEFVVSHNAKMPWVFKPKNHDVAVHPGELATTAYYAKNPTGHTMYAQAIPSISPSKASKYFKKVECFCFARQKLGPGETAHLNLRFYLSSNLPQDIHRVTLAYTIFDVTNEYKQEELTHG